MNGNEWSRKQNMVWSKYEKSFATYSTTYQGLHTLKMSSDPRISLKKLSLKRRTNSFKCRKTMKGGREWKRNKKTRNLIQNSINVSVKVCTSILAKCRSYNGIKWKSKKEWKRIFYSDGTKSMKWIWIASTHPCMYTHMLLVVRTKLFSSKQKVNDYHILSEYEMRVNEHHFAVYSTLPIWTNSTSVFTPACTIFRYRFSFFCWSSSNKFIKLMKIQLK